MAEETDPLSSPDPTPRNTSPNPHADIERVASDAIARPVRCERVEDGVAHLSAPRDTTLFGCRAIIAAMGIARPGLVCMVVLDEPEAEP